ncbi:MAG: hypothetical protein WC732_02620 [Candidatus Omnitrophota bacterium]
MESKAENKVERKWYFKISTLVIAFLCVGPLALPLLWINPYFSKKNKALITLAVMVLSYILAAVMTQSIKSIFSYYREMELL